MPSPKLPVFCTNLGKDFVTQVVVAYAIAKQLAPFVQPGFWHLPNGNTSAPLVVADVDLLHDPVPIDGVRSDGVYYGFFVPNAIYAFNFFIPRKYVNGEQCTNVCPHCADRVLVRSTALSAQSIYPPLTGNNPYRLIPNRQVCTQGWSSGRPP